MRVTTWIRTSDTAPPRAGVVAPTVHDRFADAHEVWSPPAFLLPEANPHALPELPPPRPLDLLDSKTRATVAVLVRGGLDEGDAVELLTRGVTAATATDMASVRMLQPSTQDYGASLLALRLVSEARATGGLTAARARAICEAHRSMVIVRPDGVVADVTTGRAIERRSSPSMRDGRLEAGGLAVGATYHVSGGVLREVGAAFEPGAVAGELALERGTVGAALDGVWRDHHRRRRPRARRARRRWGGPVLRSLVERGLERE